MMGDEAVSIISDSVIEEVFDSNNTTRLSMPPKQGRFGSSICSSKFRGVVSLPNGHWGCQIYANHQRIWLGTFKSEKEAAMAYDSAALKLRSGDCRRNFPLTDVTVKEPNFQSCYSTEALLNMLKDGSYQLKFADFTRTHLQNTTKTEVFHAPDKTQSDRRVTYTQLFQKELTPSDVGKLNRLVIPKKFAVKFFANLSARDEEKIGADIVGDRLLTFVDKSMKLWKFRSCYWKSSHSYVFTRGWNGFVKEKQLKALDIIVFSLCECWENAKVAQTYYMIDVLNRENNCTLLEPSNQSILTGMEDKLQLGQSTGVCDNIEKNIMDIEEMKMGNDADKKSFRLFGIEIV